MIARELFPCWDESALEATFKISIKHHKKYAALSNMPKEAIIDEKIDKINDMIWTHFKYSSIVPIHLIILMIPNNNITSYTNITFWIGWCKEDMSNMTRYMQYVFFDAKQVLHFLQKQNITIEIPEMNYVVLDTEYNSFESRELIFQRYNIRYEQLFRQKKD